MAGFNPGRRFLWLSAWGWLLVASILVTLAWSVPPPLTLSEPASVTRLFEPDDTHIFLARNGDEFRVVPNAERFEITPLWNVNRWIKASQTTRVDYYYILPGFYRQAAEWEYGLHATPFRKSGAPNRGESRLSEENIDHIRPLVVAELSARFPEEQLGNRLQRVLDEGARRESRLSFQNGIIALAWFSLPVAVLAFISMFRPQSAVTPSDANGEEQEEVGLPNRRGGTGKGQT